MSTCESASGNHALNKPVVVSEETLTEPVLVSDVAPGAKGRDWCVKAVVVVIPTPQNIAEMRARMEAVAHALKGDYDGWGAPIVPKP